MTTNTVYRLYVTSSWRPLLSYHLHYNILQNTTYNHLFELDFNPITVQNDKYNSDLDINNFYFQIRQLNLPNREYTFIDELALSTDMYLITLFFLNIPSIPSNLNNVFDTVISHYVSPYDAGTGRVVALVFTSKIICSSILNNVTFSEPHIECINIEYIISGKSNFFPCIYRPPSANIEILEYIEI